MMKDERYPTINISEMISILAADFVSVEPSRTILSISRSKLRFENHAGSKTLKSLKNDGNFDVFC